MNFLFISCDSNEVLEFNDIDPFVKNKKFNYEITDGFSEYINSSDNSSLNKDYDIKVEFKDSLDNLIIYIVKSNTKDTVFSSIGSNEISPSIEEYGNYDIILIPEESIEINDRKTVFRDTVKLKNYIQLHYNENWQDVISTNQFLFQSSEEHLKFIDKPSQEFSVNSFKLYKNFNKCNEILLKFRYVIDQKNRASGQKLPSRLYFEIFKDNISLFKIFNGTDSIEEEKQVYLSNISSEFQLFFNKILTYKYSDWKIISGGSNTKVESDTIYSLAYDSLKHIGFPKFLRLVDSLNDDSLSINNSIEKLSFFLEKESLNNSLVYGQTNSNLDIDGESFQLNSGAGNYDINFDLINSFSPTLNINFSSGFSNNKNQFTLYLTKLQIDCL